MKKKDYKKNFLSDNSKTCGTNKFCSLDEFAGNSGNDTNPDNFFDREEEKTRKKLIKEIFNATMMVKEIFGSVNSLPELSSDYQKEYNLLLEKIVLAADRLKKLSEQAGNAKNSDELRSIEVDFRKCYEFLNETTKDFSGFLYNLKEFLDNNASNDEYGGISSFGDANGNQYEKDDQISLAGSEKILHEIVKIAQNLNLFQSDFSSVDVPKKYFAYFKKINDEFASLQNNFLLLIEKLEQDTKE
ncbi:MAG: hypothetical protein LBH37_03450 [Oscillospiraceae bacterium]|nr:hypothetical protein [Oscillospiraceae bacterium]